MLLEGDSVSRRVPKEVKRRAPVSAVDEVKRPDVVARKDVFGGANLTKRIRDVIGHDDVNDRRRQATGAKGLPTLAASARSSASGNRRLL